MLLTITNTTTSPAATDLGYLLHKHPDRVHTVSLSFGTARVFFPEALPERCTVALLVDVDPVGLARGKGDGRDGSPLEPYVNDRPYAASSFLSVAIARTLASALAGRCEQRPELIAQSLNLEERVFLVLPCRGREENVAHAFRTPWLSRGSAADSASMRPCRSGGLSRYLRVVLRTGASPLGASGTSLCADPRSRRCQALLGR